MVQGVYYINCRNGVSWTPRYRGKEESCGLLGTCCIIIGGVLWAPAYDLDLGFLQSKGINCHATNPPLGCALALAKGNL